MAAVFVLTKVQGSQTPEQRAKLLATLGREFPNGWRDLGGDSYLVSTPKPLITQDISRITGITDGGVGAYLVTTLDPYFGWASASTWEWIRAMKEQDGQT